MNYRSETTRLDFSSVLRKRRTKTTCGGAILTNFNNSQSIFCSSFFGEFLLRGIFEQGRLRILKRSQNYLLFWIAGYPLHPDPSSSHFCKAHQGDFHRDGDDGLVRRLAKQRIERP